MSRRRFITFAYTSSARLASVCPICAMTYAGPDPGDIIQARAVLRYRAKLDGNDAEVARILSAEVDELRVIAAKHASHYAGRLARRWLGQPV